MCKQRCTRSAALIAFWLLGLAAQTCVARTLDIALNDVRTAGATFYMAVYTVGEGQGSWQQEPYQTLKFILPKDTLLSANTTVELQLDLPDGRYAIRGYIDIDGSGKLETARFNRPTEPFTISSGAGRDKPSVHFHNAVFTLNDTNTSLQLTLFYPDDARVQEQPSDELE